MRYRITLAVLIALGAVVLARLLIGDSLVALLTPRGTIASQERDVIVKSALVMLAFAVPMLAALYALAWKYRAGNPKAKYDPDRPHGPLAEIALWALLAAGVSVLAFIAWGSAHRLDPYKEIASKNPPVTIEAVALRWKWLFIYPEQHIATVNYIAFPENTPVHFDLTADGPMSSFWIPQLGSQIYAMAAMQTQLDLMASSVGEYQGKDTEINGQGYAGMTFTAHSVTKDDFDAWVRQVQGSPQSLDRSSYAELAKPSTYDPPAFYALGDDELYEWVVMKDMVPPSNGGSMNDMKTTAPGTGM